MMTVTFNDNVNSYAVDKPKKNNNESFNNTNDFCNSYEPKIAHKEFIASPLKTIENQATFQGAMQLTIIIGQCFGVMPVLGVSEIDTSKLRFTYFSGRCVYSIISIVGQMCLVILCFLKLFNGADNSLSSNSSLVFFTTNCFTGIMFLRLASRWPRVSQHVSRTESTDPTLDKSLVKKCNISCIVVLSLAVFEHLLSDLCGFAIAIDCHPDKSVLEGYFYQSFYWAWPFVPFNFFSAFFTQFFNIQCTFNWNFADAFVICVSWYLYARLDQVNQRITTVRGKYVPSSFWRTMREDYSRTSNMIKKVDDAIGGIIFISFANNLFFICLQLLHTLEEGIKVTAVCHRQPDERPFRGYEQAVYFVYSFSFLLARSLAVSLIAAKVHTASRQPAQTLYDVPSEGYCIEVQRFLMQVQGDTVSLSGLQFFNVKRGLVLTVAGTIVTYELVLMQFAGVSPTIAPFLSPTLPISP